MQTNCFAAGSISIEGGCSITGWRHPRGLDIEQMALILPLVVATSYDTTLGKVLGGHIPQQSLTYLEIELR